MIVAKIGVIVAKMPVIVVKTGMIVALFQERLLRQVTLDRRRLTLTRVGFILTHGRFTLG